MKKIMYFAFGIGIAINAQAQWSNDPQANTVVTNATGEQVDFEATTDGNNGIIVTWEDDRASTNDVYAQRLDNGGTAQWNANGLEIASGNFLQENVDIVSDGANGAVIVWQDRQSSTGARFDILGQRVDAAGGFQWGASGKVVNDYTDAGALFNSKKNPSIAFDGQSFFVGFQDQRNTKDDVFGQKLDMNGSLLWNADGEVIYDGAADKSEIQMIPEGAGGVNVICKDDDNLLGPGIYYQQLNASGVAQLVPTAQLNGFFLNAGTLVSVSDGSAGYVSAWIQDDHSNGTFNVFVQHITGNTPSWNGGTNIALLSSTAYAPDNVDIIRSGSDYFIAWEDSRSGDKQIYMQKIDQSGNPLWAADGIDVVTGPGDVTSPRLANDGGTGVYLVWNDLGMIKAKLIDAAGADVWSSNTSVSNSASNNEGIKVIETTDGIIVVWADYRNGNADIFAQKVMDDGTLPSGVIAPVADFTFNVNGADVAFLDASSNSPTNFEWDFDDSSPVDNSKNTAHTYTASGNYNVCFTVTNTAGSDSTCKMVSVSIQLPPSAGFEFTVNGMEAQFNDTSSNVPISWSWDFGDGNSSILQDPVHTYDSAGTYNACLVASNGAGADSTCASVVIQDTSSTTDGVHDINEQESFFLIHPNPAGNSTTVQIQPQVPNGGVITLYNQMGKQVTRQSVEDDRTQLDISQLPAGFYLIEYRHQDLPAPQVQQLSIVR